MFPVIAVGAALAVAAIAAGELAPSPKTKAAAKKEEGPAPLPQSYLVTPLSQKGEARQITPMEGVRNFIF